MTQAGAGGDFCRLSMSCQPANAHEAQVSPPNSTHHPPFPSDVLDAAAYLLGVVLAAEGGLAGGDLGADPGDVELEVASPLLLLPVVRLAGVQQDHPLKVEILVRNIGGIENHRDGKCIAHLAYLYRVGLWEQMRQGGPGINNLLTSSLQPHNAPSGLWQQDLQQNNTPLQGEGENICPTLKVEKSKLHSSLVFIQT